MNITVFYANKRKNKSSTYGIAQLIIKNLRNNDELFEFYLPYDMPHICIGCYACLKGKEEKCGGSEYLEPIKLAMEKSELIIFCSPTYVFHTPGQIKSLLDHFSYRWLIHRPDQSFLNKQAVIINTAGGGGMKSTVKDIKDRMDYWGVARTHIIKQSVWNYDWTNMPENFRKSIDRKIKRTVDKIVKCKNHLTPSLKVKVLYLIYTNLHKRKKMAKIDYDYWYEKGYVK